MFPKISFFECRRRKLSSLKEKKQQRELHGMKILPNKLEDLTDTKENNPQNGNVKEESRNIKSSGKLFFLEIFAIDFINE